MIVRTDETLDVAVPGSGPMRTHLVRPAVAGRFPGVLLFSEIYQVTAPIRRLASVVAGHGYVVAIPEVYHEYEPAGVALAYDQSGTDRGNALKYTKTIAAYDADARAALAALADRSLEVGIAERLALSAPRPPEPKPKPPRSAGPGGGGCAWSAEERALRRRLAPCNWL